MKTHTNFPADENGYRTYDIKYEKSQHGETRYELSIDGEHIGWVVKSEYGNYAGLWEVLTSRHGDFASTFRGLSIGIGFELRKEAVDELLFYLSRHEVIDGTPSASRSFRSLPFTILTEEEWMNA